MNKILFYNILSTILLNGISIFTSPIFSRMMGTNNYGILSMYTTWVSVVSTVYCLQTNATITVAKKAFPENEQAKYQSSILSLGFISYVILSIVTILLVIPLSYFVEIDLIILIFILLNGLGQFSINFLNNKLTYEFKAKSNVMLSITYTLSSTFIAIALLFILPKDVNYFSRIIGNTAVSLIICLFVVFYFLKEGKTIYNKTYWKYCLPLSIPIIFHNLSTIILGQSDKLMIQYFIDNSNLGIYSLALNFSNVMNIIWTSLNNSWVPFYYDFSRKKEDQIMLKHAKNYIELFTILAMGFILLSPEVYHIFAGEEFWSGTILIPIMVVGTYMTFLYSFQVNYEFFHEKTKTIASATVVAAVVNIALNFVFIYYLGITGATLATAIAHCIQFLIHYYFAKRIKTETPFPFRFRLFIPAIIALTISIIMFYFVPTSLWFIRWGFGAAIGLYLLRNIINRKSIF